MPDAEAKITAVRTAAYVIPTDTPESDGTLEWDSTTLVVVEIDAAGATGVGYTYSHKAAATLISEKLADVLTGADGFAIRARWQAMLAACRNMGTRGIAASAIAACDVALHDLAGKLTGLPVAVLLGRRHETISAYGSGGFTSYDDVHLCEQLAGWAEGGFPSVKMKVGRDGSQDERRVRAARAAIGPRIGLMVDANGAYTRKQAIAMSDIFAHQNVTWFEEPVSSDDLEGLRLIRDRSAAELEISAGEYGFDDFYFRHMIDAGAIDVLQADATRCQGYTGFMLADALAHAANLPLSSHCAPALHLPCAHAAQNLRHMEWFHDHVRIEQMLFDGAPQPRKGQLSCDFSRPGIGLDFKYADARQFHA